MRKKSGHFEKTVKVAGATIKLYSLDGNIWSSRKEELKAIAIRMEEKAKAFAGKIVTEEDKAAAATTETAEAEPEDKSSKKVVVAPKQRLTSKPAKKQKAAKKSKRAA